ncbi:MAG: hypothetical protein ACOYL9_06040 [Ilumatobacteraceae bacterium]
MTDVDPTLLPLDELRALRGALQHDDDAVSYVRRVAQARLDRIEAELRHRGAVPGAVAEELPSIIGSQLTGGAARPPRPAVDASEHPLALEFERLWSDLGGTDIASLADGELATLHDAVRAFERERSKERQTLFARIDTLSAELVRRYREGEADVNGLLGDE